MRSSHKLRVGFCEYGSAPSIYRFLPLPRLQVHAHKAEVGSRPLVEAEKGACRVQDSGAERVKGGEKEEKEDGELKWGLGPERERMRENQGFY